MVRGFVGREDFSKAGCLRTFFGKLCACQLQALVGR